MLPTRPLLWLGLLVSAQSWCMFGRGVLVVKNERASDAQDCGFCGNSRVDRIFDCVQYVAVSKGLGGNRRTGALLAAGQLHAARKLCQPDADITIRILRSGHFVVDSAGRTRLAPYDGPGGHRERRSGRNRLPIGRWENVSRRRWTRVASRDSLRTITHRSGRQGSRGGCEFRPGRDPAGSISARARTRCGASDPTSYEDSYALAARPPREAPLASKYAADVSGAAEPSASGDSQTGDGPPTGDVPPTEDGASLGPSLSPAPAVPARRLVPVIRPKPEQGSAEKSTSSAHGVLRLPPTDQLGSGAAESTPPLPMDPIPIYPSTGVE